MGSQLLLYYFVSPCTVSYLFSPPGESARYQGYNTVTENQDEPGLPCNVMSACDTTKRCMAHNAKVQRRCVLPQYTDKLIGMRPGYEIETLNTHTHAALTFFRRPDDYTNFRVRIADASGEEEAVAVRVIISLARAISAVLNDTIGRRIGRTEMARTLSDAAVA